MSIHGGKNSWREETGGNLDSNLGDPAQPVVAFNAFTPPPDQNVLLRKHVIKSLSNGDYSSWSTDQTATGWSNWYLTGYAGTLFPGTGSLPIVAFSAFVHPDTNDIRQHLVRGDTTNGYFIYSRDRSKTTWSSWFLAGKVSDLLPQAGSRPVVDFSATSFANKGILQHFVIGDPVTGYDLYSRARVNNVWSVWAKEDEMWDQGTGSYPVTAFHATAVANGLVDYRIVRRNPNSGKYTIYFERIRNFWDDNNSPVLGATTTDTGVSTYLDEAQLFTPLYKKAATVVEQKQLDFAQGPLPYPDTMRSFRVIADGNWKNVKPTQTYPTSVYDGNKYPAGSLRAGNNPDGFTPISGDFDLPGLKQPSFNNPGCATKPQFICNYWSDLNTPVIGNKTELDYLRRQHLDRLESMITIDILVGQLLSTLESKNLLNNTLIVFTSDNGYFLGDFRLTNKQLPYEQSIRVPLVIRPPNSVLTTNLKNINMVVNLDLPATIVDYAGLWTSYSAKIDGRSLKPILSSAQTNLQPWRKLFLEEFRYPRGRPVTDWIQAMGVPDLRAIRTDTNLIYVEYTSDPLALSAPPWYEFYDLKTDSAQVNNLYNNATKSVPPAYTSILASYRTLINALSTCKGDTCRNLEN